MSRAEAGPAAVESEVTDISEFNGLLDPKNPKAISSELINDHLATHRSEEEKGSLSKLAKIIDWALKNKITIPDDTLVKNIHNIDFLHNEEYGNILAIFIKHDKLEDLFKQLNNFEADSLYELLNANSNCPITDLSISKEITSYLIKKIKEKDPQFDPLYHIGNSLIDPEQALLLGKSAVEAIFDNETFDKENIYHICIAVILSKNDLLKDIEDECFAAPIFGMITIIFDYKAIKTFYNPEEFCKTIKILLEKVGLMTGEELDDDKKNLLACILKNSLQFDSPEVNELLFSHAEKCKIDFNKSYEYPGYGDFTITEDVCYKPCKEAFGIMLNNGAIIDLGIFLISAPLGSVSIDAFRAIICNRNFLFEGLAEEYHATLREYLAASKIDASDNDSLIRACKDGINPDILEFALNVENRKSAKEIESKLHVAYANKIATDFGKSKKTEMILASLPIVEESPLSAAVQSGNPKLVQYLLNQDFNPNLHIMAPGMTILATACNKLENPPERDFLQIIELLINAGAYLEDNFIKDLSGDSSVKEFIPPIEEVPIDILTRVLPEDVPNRKMLLEDFPQIERAILRKENDLLKKECAITVKAAEYAIMDAGGAFGVSEIESSAPKPSEDAPPSSVNLSTNRGREANEEISGDTKRLRLLSKDEDHART